MPVPIAEAVDQSGRTAAAKVEQAAHLPRYLLTSALAGAYVGVAVVLLVSVSGPLVAAASPVAKLVQGIVFGVALTLVVFAGAELFTGNNMFMLQGVYTRAATGAGLALVWTASLIGNFFGSVAFAALVHGAGTLSAGATGTKPGPGHALVASIVDAKNAATGSQLFWRALLCNMLVCLGLWMAARANGDGAKLAVLWWALLAFIGSGFEHSIANMTLFSLGIFEGSATWTDMGRNLMWTVPGNIVGGGVVVGLVYSYLAGARPPADPVLLDDAAAAPAFAQAGSG